MNSGEVSIKFVASTYRIGKKIDEGAFGKIYRGTKIRGSGEEYAIKMEDMRQEHPQLVGECKLYHMLHNDPMAADRGIPRVYACGVEDDFNYLVMDLMGPSLESLLTSGLKKFSLKTVLMLIDQMISRLEYLHSRNLLHRDIKPDNFCMGTMNKKNMLYILDFGLAKKYVMANGRHIPYKEGKNLTGTARYASVNTHIGLEQACRDDMESIAYVALYCLKGTLPWQGQKGGTKDDKYQRIKESKINTTVETLCKNCPE
jgi:serine/threonine protein kinase